MAESTNMMPAANGEISQLWSNAWRLDPGELNDAKQLLLENDWTTAEIVEAYLNSKAEEIAAEKEASKARPSLADIAIDAIVDSLETSGDPEEQTKLVAQALDWPIYRRLLLSGRVPYKLLKKLFEHCPHSTEDIDLDLAVIQQSKYIRKHPEAHSRVSKLFVKAELLGDAFGTNAHLKSEEDGYVVRCTREEETGLRFYDNYREESFEAYTTTSTIQHRIRLLTNDMLTSILWDNVVLIGEAPLVALRCHDRTPSVWNFELRLYDLDIQSASRKVHHIAQHIQENTGSLDLVRKSLDFTAISHQGRSVFIKHRIYPTKYAAISAEAPDSGALGFDGETIVISSLCLRAIETGYTLLTPEAIFAAEAMSENQSYTYERRLKRAAILGFGLKIPAPLTNALGVRAYTATRSGAQIVQRISTYARDWTFYHTYAETARLSPAAYSTHEDTEYDSDTEDGSDIEDDRAGLIATTPRLSPIPSFDEWLKLLPRGWPGVSDKDRIILSRSSPSSHRERGFPTRRTGVPSLEIFSHHHAQWQLAAMLPYHAAIHASCIEHSERIHTEDNLFVNVLQPAIRARTGVRNSQRTDFVNYLTRRIRCTITDADLNNVRSKQIAIPLIISQRLESYLSSLWNSGLYPRSPYILLPVHDAAEYAQQPQQPLPSLIDNDSETQGNLRYWITTNSTRWKGQDMMWDHIFEILRSLAEYFIRVSESSDATDLGDKHETVFGASCSNLKWELCMSLRRHATARKARGANTSSESRLGFSEEEIEFFKAWVLADAGLPELDDDSLNWAELPEPLPDIHRETF
jgi:hypothetical protein